MEKQISSKAFYNLVSKLYQANQNFCSIEKELIVADKDIKDCYSEGRQVFCKEYYLDNKIYKLCGSPDAVIIIDNGNVEAYNIGCPQLFKEIYKKVSEFRNIKIPIEFKNKVTSFKLPYLPRKADIYQLIKYILILDSEIGFLVYVNSYAMLIVLTKVDTKLLNETLAKNYL